MFKIKEFPHLSETFIISQIITAINLGFNVKVLVQKLLSFEESKQIDLIEKYQLSDKIIIEDYNIPKNKFFRLFKWLLLLIFNIFSISKIVKYHKIQKTFSLTWLYQLNFYRRFKDTQVFHVQYGTNKHPVDLLKAVNYLKGDIIVSFHGHDAIFPINGHIPNNGYYDILFSVSKAIVANTKYLANEIEALGCKKGVLKTIPVPVDTTYFFPNKKLNYNKGVLKLIMVSRLDLIKGHLYAFKAFKNLVEKKYNLHLTVVGEGEERGNLEKYINENELRNITLAGAKSQYEVRELLWKSDVFLFPSITLPDGRQETQGLATLEAQACGLPVVAFNTGGIKYTIDIGKSGFLCEEKSVEELTKKIEELINDVDKRTFMGQHAVNFISDNFSLEVIQNSWKVLYSTEE